MKTVKEEVEDIMNAPGFIAEHYGTSYKFGEHGFIYRWSNLAKGWIKSGVTKNVLRKPITARVTKERASETTN